MRCRETDTAYIAEEENPICKMEIRTMEQNGQGCYAFLVKEEVDRVRINDIDIYKLPRWLEGIFEEVE